MFLRPHSFQNFKSIDSGQPDVEHDQVERCFFGFAKRRFAIVDHDGIVARFGQGRGDMAGEPDFIIYDQNAHEYLT